MWFVLCALRALKSHDCTFYAWFTLARKTENGIKQSAIFRRGKSWNMDVRISETPPPPLSANVRKSITPPPPWVRTSLMNSPLQLNTPTLQARRQNNVSGGHEQCLVGHKNFLLSYPGVKTKKKKCQRCIICEKKVLALRFWGKDPPKKGLRREILGFFFAFTPVFRPGTKVYSRLENTNSILGGQKQYFWGAQGPKCTPEAPILLLSFAAQFSLGGAHFSLGGHKQWFGESTAPKCLPWRRACHFANSNYRNAELLYNVVAISLLIASL